MKRKLKSYLGKDKKNQLCGFRFKQQHPIGNYIADFCCHKAKLVVEIDGEAHSSRQQQLYDNIRTQEIEACGLRVIRFTNDEVLQHVHIVIGKIARHLTT